MNTRCERRQLIALAFVISLAPTIRLLPKSSTAAAGGVSWLSPLIAAPFVALYIAYLSAFLRYRRENEGLGEVICRAVGDKAGRVVLALSGAFFVFYCGFILRSGADRLIGTVYPAASPWLFVFVMLGIGLAAALGRTETLLRMAKMLAPVLAAVLIGTVAFGLSSVETAHLLPDEKTALSDLSYSAVPVFDIFAGVLAFTAFAEGVCPERAGRTRGYLRFALPLCLLMAALIASVVGNYGAALTLRLSHPYFTTVRDITVFRSMERLEALVVALWVFPDFLLTALMLKLAHRSLAAVLGFRIRENAPPQDMKNGRWLLPVCAVSAGIIACLLPTDAAALEVVSEKTVPMLNLILSAGVYPLCFAVGCLRGRLKGS